MPKDDLPKNGCRTGRPVAVAAQDPDYLTYANIRQLIDQHLEERSLMLDVQTRFLLSRLSETAGARADHKRAEIEARLKLERGGAEG